MIIEPFFYKIRNIPVNINQNEFIDKIKNIESDFFKFLSNENKTKWYIGKGLAISNSLAKIKDLVIKKIIEFLNEKSSGIDVIAVGGYGREELSPNSDIDILILHEEKSNIEKFIGKFLYILWDLNYIISHSTRTLKNIIEQSRTDKEFLTSIYQSRLITGDEKLFLKFKNVLEKIARSTKLELLRSNTLNLFQIIQNNSYEILLKEPDLKKSIGGLRSVHLMEWLNFAFFGHQGLTGLKNILPEILYKRLYINYDFILYLRNMLHFITSRKCDILYIDYHLNIANNLAYKGNDYEKMLKLMKMYYDKANDIFLTLLFLINELNKKIINKLKRKKQKKEFFILNNNFYVNDDIKPEIEKALDFLYKLAKGNYNFSYSLAFYLKKCSILINDQTLYSKDVFKKIISILSLDNSYVALNAMKLSGIIYALLKPFAKVKNAIIYNPFHDFTIDEHSIQTVKALEHLYKNDFNEYDKNKFYILKKIASDYHDKIWIIKIALIFHDLGKAYSGDHSKTVWTLQMSY